MIAWLFVTRSPFYVYPLNSLSAVNTHLKHCCVVMTTWSRQSIVQGMLRLKVAYTGHLGAWDAALKNDMHYQYFTLHKVLTQISGKDS